MATVTVSDQTPTGAANLSASTLQPGVITPSVANTLFISVLSDQFLNPHAIDSGFSIIDQNSGSVSEDGAMAYLVQSSVTATNPTWNITNAHEIAVLQANFFPSAASSAASISATATLSASLAGSPGKLAANISGAATVAATLKGTGSLIANVSGTATGAYALRS